MSIEFEDEATMRNKFSSTKRNLKETRKSFGAFLIRIHVAKTPQQADYILVTISLLFIIGAIVISWFNFHKTQTPLKFNPLIPQQIQDAMSK